MTSPQTTEIEARGERLSAIVPLGVDEDGNADCEQVIQEAFQMGKAMRSAAEHQYREFVLRGWPSQKVSSQEVSKPVNNLHLNGGGLDGLIDDAFKLAYRECAGNMTETAEKLKIGRGTAYDYRKRLNLA